jgi:integrase
VTIEKLRRQLKPFVDEFGDRTIRSLEGYELAIHRKTGSPRSRHDRFRAIKQTMAQWVRWGWIESSPADAIKNPKPRRPEVQIPPWEDVAAIDDEIDERWQGVAAFLATGGFRIEEFAGLHRDHIDIPNRVAHVRQVFSGGRLVELGVDGSKTWRQRRDVPLRQVTLDALARRLTRIDCPQLYPAARGGYLDTDRWREKYWAPAVRAAGVTYFPPKNLRHVYASESIAAGMDLFTLSRRMGTSMKEIDDTYGHLVHDAHERELERMDAWDVAAGRIEAL